MTPLTFDGVNVVDVEHGTLVPNQRVVIAGNRIQAIGDASTVKSPAGAHVVDAHGKYLIPGLWDIHVHPMHAATDIFYPLFVANGVTGIRDAASPTPLDTLVLWRRQILAGSRVGPPRQILSGPGLDEAGTMVTATCDSIPEYHVCMKDSTGARRIVDSLKAAGADMIKMYSLNKDGYYAAAAEARRIGIRFGGHIQWESEVTAVEASDSGASILDHINAAGGLDSFCLGLARDGDQGWGRHVTSTANQCGPIAERFRRNGTWFAPTLIAYADFGVGGERSMPILERLRSYTSTTSTDSSARGNWLHTADSATTQPTSADDSVGIMRVIQQVGLPVLAGSDVANGAQAGFSLHGELAMLVAEGLTPLNALQSATINPAKLLHATDSLGTVATGKLADLILLDANPLTDITNTTTIRAVVANGRYFDRAALDSLLVESRARVRRNP